MYFRAVVFFVCFAQIVTLLMALFPVSVVASEPHEKAKLSLEILAVDVGIEGAYKNGLWMPIKISWFGNLGQGGIVIKTVDSDGTEVVLETKSPEQNIGCKTEEVNNITVYTDTIYVRHGRNDAPITISLHPGLLAGSETALSVKPNGKPGSQLKPTVEVANSPKFRFAEPIPSERPVFVVLGEDNLGIQDAVNMMREKETRRPILVNIPSFADLPDSHLGYEAVDLVVLNTSNPAFFDGVGPSDVRLLALDRWMRLGGHLFINLGKDCEPLISGHNAPLKNFVPGEFKELRLLRQALPLEHYSGSGRSILMDGSNRAPFLRVPLLTSVKGTVALSEGEVPLLVRTPKEFGMLTYFGCDLAGTPLEDWRDRGLLVYRILRLEESRSEGVAHSGTSLTHLGYTDLSGQIRSALDEFEGVKNIPFSVILLLILAYLLAVFLGDRFLVRQVLKRPLLTWVSFPLITVIFCVLAWYLGTLGRPTLCEVNQLDVLDFDLESGSVRCSSWFGLYSPDDASYTLELSPQAAGNPLEVGKTGANWLSWHGLPGSAIGGMSPRALSPSPWDNAYIGCSESPLMQSVPIQGHSTKSFFGQWYAPEFAGPSKTNIGEKDGIPVGTFRNETGFRLEKCFLVHRRWVLELGTIEVGESIPVGTHTPRRDVKYIVSSPDPVFDVNAIVQDTGHGTFSSRSKNLDYILRAMTFYRAVGANEGIGLSNSHQRWIDLSPLIQGNRAILIGRATENPEDSSIEDMAVSRPFGNELSLDAGEIASTTAKKTIIRVVIPVGNSPDGQ